MAQVAIFAVRSSFAETLSFQGTLVVGRGCFYGRAGIFHDGRTGGWTTSFNEQPLSRWRDWFPERDLGPAVTYIVGEESGAGINAGAYPVRAFIECRLCHARSYNPNDVKRRWCANCGDHTRLTDARLNGWDLLFDEEVSPPPKKTRSWWRRQ